MFDLIHCDLWGPYTKSSGFHYFLTIVDDHSRAVWIYLIKEKSEVTGCLRHFCAMVKTQYDKIVKKIRSDNGTEFTTSLLKRFFQQMGILFQSSCVGTPQQNGRIERKHRNILEVARALMFQASLPIQFWSDCVQAAVHLINRTPTTLLEGKSPYEILFHSAPNMDLLKVFGCLCYAHNKPRQKDKFAPRSRKCVFMGYPFGKKGWRVFDLEKKEFFISRDVRFVEDVFPFSTNSPVTPPVSSVTEFADLNFGVPITSSHSPAPPLSPASTTSEERRSVSTPHQTPTPIVYTRRPRTTLPGSSSEPVVRQFQDETSLAGAPPSVDRQLRENEASTTLVDDTPPARQRRPPSWHADYICSSTRHIHPISSTTEQSSSSGTQFPIANYVSYANFNTNHRNFVDALNVNKGPKSYKEASKHERWRKAMRDEIDALEKNKTLEITDLPPGKKAIGCQGVFKTKLKHDGSFERDKARLVVLENHQKEGEDFTDTSALVAKLVTVHTFLAVAVARKWEVHQLDVNNAFLHGDLNEEVYMRLPPGFSSSVPGKVCRLRKSLYGLRQSPRNWFAKLTSSLRKYGFQQSHADYTPFTYKIGDDVLSVLVYVDDILVAGNNSTLCSSFKRYLDDCFRLKDLGPLKYFFRYRVF